MDLPGFGECRCFHAKLGGDAPNLCHLLAANGDQNALSQVKVILRTHQRIIAHKQGMNGQDKLSAAGAQTDHSKSPNDGQRLDFRSGITKAGYRVSMEKRSIGLL